MQAVHPVRVCSEQQAACNAPTEGNQAKTHLGVWAHSHSVGPLAPARRAEAALRLTPTTWQTRSFAQQDWGQRVAWRFLFKHTRHFGKTWRAHQRSKFLKMLTRVQRYLQQSPSNFTGAIQTLNGVNPNRVLRREKLMLRYSIATGGGGADSSRPGRNIKRPRIRDFVMFRDSKPPLRCNQQSSRFLRACIDAAPAISFRARFCTDVIALVWHLPVSRDAQGAPVQPKRSVSLTHRSGQWRTLWRKVQGKKAS
jgi:hypothetical protein